MGLTPTMANAVSSNTYFIGFPDWLPIGDGNTLESNPNTIYEAILDSKDKNPLIGWGTGGVALDPQWVQWYNPSLTAILDPTSDQYYTPEVEDPAYTQAFGTKKAELIAADKTTILNSQTIQLRLDLATIPNNGISQSLWALVPDSVRYVNVTVPNPFLNNPDALDAVLAGGNFGANYAVSVPIQVPNPAYPFGPKYLVNTTVSGNVPYTVNLANFNLTSKDYDQLAHDYVVNELGIAQTIPGYWTTNTYGQWVSPTDELAALANLDLSDLAGLASGDLDLTTLAGLAGLSPKDLAYFLSGDTGFLAPLLNWTTYIQNINLIAYGDGAIAAGEAYRRFIEAVENGEIKAGEPKTDGLYIVINPDGQQVIRLVNTNAGSITDIPLPDDLTFPDAPEGELSYVETPGGVIDITLITLALLRNPGRPNGGLYARFAPIYQELTGVNPVSPERTDVLYGLPEDTVTKLMNGDTSGVQLDDLNNLQVFLNDANGKPIVITIKADATWEYDLLSDAPVNASPIAWANSLMSSMLVLTYGSELVGMATGDTGSGVGVVAYTVPDGEYDAGSFYATLTTESLPLLAPIRLVAGLLSAATGEEVNTPVADALEPVLKLLVNTSYTDVVRNEDGTWTRTLDQMHVPTLFGTQTLTRHQAALLAGDIIAELGKGMGSEYTDVVQRVTARVVTFLEDNDIRVPTEIKEAAAKLATEPGKAIQTVSREIGDGVSKVLTTVDQALPEGPAAPTQQQLAGGQREVGKALAEVKTGADGVVAQVNSVAEQTGLDKAAGEVESAGKKIQADVTKRVTKTQKSLTHAQERAGKVADKLKQGDLKGAAKQVGDNVKNRVDRLKKDINNGVDKLKGKDKKDDES